MTTAKDISAPGLDDNDLAMFRNVMEATGLPREDVESFLAADGDLDDLCDSVLARLAGQTQAIR